MMELIAYKQQRFPAVPRCIPQVSKSLSLTTHRQERGEQTTSRMMEATCYVSTPQMRFNK